MTTMRAIRGRGPIDANAGEREPARIRRSGHNAKELPWRSNAWKFGAIASEIDIGEDHGTRRDHGLGRRAGQEKIDLELIAGQIGRAHV